MKVIVTNRDVTYAQKPIQYLPNFAEMTNSPNSFCIMERLKYRAYYKYSTEVTRL